MRITNPSGGRNPFQYDEATHRWDPIEELDSDHLEPAPRNVGTLRNSPQSGSSIGSSTKRGLDNGCARPKKDSRSVSQRIVKKGITIAAASVLRVVRTVDGLKYPAVKNIRYAFRGDFPEQDLNRSQFHPGVPRLLQRTAITMWNQRRISRDLAADKVTRRPPSSDRHVIMDFLTRMEFSGSMPAGHSHPEAALERTIVTQMFGDAARLIGKLPYAVSWCPRDANLGIRLNYLAKDAGTPSRADVVPESAVLTGVDVVDYLDVNELARYGNIMLFYSQVPERVAGKAPDGLYTLELGDYNDKAGHASVKGGTILHNRVTGGSSYRHPMWDWSIDHFTTVDWWGNSIMYLVETRRCPSGRWIIACFPTAITAFPLWWGRPCVEVRRKNCIVKAPNGTPVLVNEYHDGEKAMMSVGLPGLWRSCELQPLHYMGWLAKFRASKTAMVGDVERYMKCSKLDAEEALAWAPIVYTLLAQDWTPAGVPVMAIANVIVRRGKSAIHYCSGHPDDANFPVREMENHTISRAFAPCLVTVPSQAPSDLAENECAAHRIRVRDAQKRLATYVVPHKYKALAREFTGMILDEIGRGEGVPLTLDELYDQHWTRPTQQAQMGRVDCLKAVTGELKGFLKKEIGLKPRFISDVPTEQKAHFGCFTHAITKAMKEKLKWVGCGRSPEWVAQRVADIATGKDVPEHLRPVYPAAAEGDITNCDGSEMRWDRDYLLDPLMFSFFAECYRYELRGHLDFEKPIPEKMLRMKNGHHFKILWELMSGASRTTWANIVKCSFREYCALRQKIRCPKLAFALIGIHCGDDSVMHEFAFPMGEIRVRVATELGMEMKLINRVSTHTDPLTFLGEYYLNPWCGDVVRVPDFWRQACKIHLTCNGSVGPEQAAINKAAGVLSGSGVFCPALGPWAEKIVALLEPRGFKPKDMQRNELWKVVNEGNSELVEPVELTRARVRDLWCEIMGVDGAALEVFLEKLAKATNLDELPFEAFDNTLRAKEPLGSHREDGWQGAVLFSNGNGSQQQQQQQVTPGARAPAANGPSPGGAASAAGGPGPAPRPATQPQASPAASDQQTVAFVRFAADRPIGDDTRQPVLALRGGGEDHRRVQGNDGVLPDPGERHSDHGRQRQRPDAVPPELVLLRADLERNRKQHDGDVLVRPNDGGNHGVRAGLGGGGPGWTLSGRGHQPALGGQQVPSGGVGGDSQDPPRCLKPRAYPPDEIHSVGEGAGEVSGRDQGQAGGGGGAQPGGDLGGTGARRSGGGPFNRAGKQEHDRSVHTAAGAAVERVAVDGGGAEAHPNDGDDVDRGPGGERGAGPGKADQQRVPGVEGDWTLVGVGGRRVLGVHSVPERLGDGARVPEPGPQHLQPRDGPQLLGPEWARWAGGGGERGGGLNRHSGLRGDLSHRGDAKDPGAAHKPAAARGGRGGNRAGGAAGRGGPRAPAALPAGAPRVSRDGERGGGRAGGQGNPRGGGGAAGNGGQRGRAGNGKGPGRPGGRDVRHGALKGAPAADDPDEAEASAWFNYYDRLHNDPWADVEDLR